MLIKKTILKNNKDNYLTIPLSIKENVVGLQQEIDSITQFETNKSINDVNDNEIIILKFAGNYDTIFNFQFYNGNWNNSYLNADFTEEEYNTNDITFANSFYIFNVFDTYKKNIQNIINYQYITTLKNGNTNTLLAEYNIANQSQMKYLFFPKYIFNEIDNEKIFYLKPLFYNAKKGILTIFEINGYSPSNLFIEIVVNKQNMSWFPNCNSILNCQYNFREMTNNSYYRDELNKTMKTLPILLPNYPDGNVFNYETINYENID